MFPSLPCVFARGTCWIVVQNRRPDAQVRLSRFVLRHLLRSLRSEIHSRLARRYDEVEGQEDEEFLPNAEGKKPVRFTDVSAGMDWGKPAVMSDQKQTHSILSV